MCFADPAESLKIARARLTPEQWAKFERQFDDFCVTSGLPDKWAYWPTYDWAKWAFFSAMPRELELTGGYPCTTSPCTPYEMLVPAETERDRCFWEKAKHWFI